MIDWSVFCVGYVYANTQSTAPTSGYCAAIHIFSQLNNSLNSVYAFPLNMANSYCTPCRWQVDSCITSSWYCGVSGAV